MADEAFDVATLAKQGVAALMAGNATAARATFERIVAAGKADVPVWHALAVACQRTGDAKAMLAAADRVLEVNKWHIPALMLKGDHYDSIGDDRAALSFYGVVIALSNQMSERPGPDIVAAVQRARAKHDASSAKVLAHLNRSVAAAGFERGSSSERFAHALDLLSGAKTRYSQQPRSFYFPELPVKQFYQRSELDWIDKVEAAASDITNELKAVMGDEDDFVPYIERDANRPLDDRMGLMGSKKWSAYFLWKDGEPVAAHAARCPKTMQALAHVPLTRIKGRAPSILFSRLLPGAVIPPHNGFINTRLICHLPLITPKGCRFRVGNDVREWENGKVWAFDDTIEHEAANPSNETRIILIFEIWRPELTEEERALVAATIEAVDSYQGAAKVRWDD